MDDFERDEYMQNRANTFAKNLKKLLSVNDKYQQNLVEDFHVSKSTVSSWVNGKKVPRPDMVKRLCAYFSITEQVLFGEDNNHEFSSINPLSVQIAILLQRKDERDSDFLRAYNVLDESDREMLRDIAIRLAMKKE